MPRGDGAGPPSGGRIRKGGGGGPLAAGPGWAVYLPEVWLQSSPYYNSGNPWGIK